MEAGHRASTTTGSFALNAMRPSVTPQITPSQASFVMPSRPSSKPFYSAPRPHNFSQAPQATAQAIQLDEPIVSDNETTAHEFTYTPTLGEPEPKSNRMYSSHYCTSRMT